MHFISGSQHLPSHLTRSGLSPNIGNFSEKWAWELCCSPLDSRLYINSGEDRCSSEHCLLFVFSVSSPPHTHSVLSLLWKTRRQKHYSCPRWISCADLSVCISQSLVRHSTRPLYFFVDFLNRPFIPGPCRLPPLVHKPTVHRMLHLLGIIPIR